MKTEHTNFIEHLERMLNAAKDVWLAWPEDDGTVLEKSLDLYPFKQSFCDLVDQDLPKFVEAVKKELSRNEYEVSFRNGPKVKIKGESILKAMCANGYGHVAAQDFEYKKVE
jgi:hypothetical protein